MIKILTVNQEEGGKRVDSFLVEKVSGYSRAYFSKLIKAREIKVNGEATKPSYRIQAGDTVEINFVDTGFERLPEPEEIPLDIIYEDANVIVINKPAGLVVHPAAGNRSGTLINALLAHFPKINQAVYDRNKIVSQMRPGLVHRLDKDTSGVLIVAKNLQAMNFLARQISGRKARKIYWALCYGWPKEDSGHLTNYVGRHPKERKMMAEIGSEKGREAVSDYKVINYLTGNDGTKYSLIEFDIQTGRTHQIRLQAKLMNHPVVGDLVYNTKESAQSSTKLGAVRQLLHARKLIVRLPGKISDSSFESALPPDFERVLSKLKKI